MSNQVRPVPLTAAWLRHCPGCGCLLEAPAPVTCRACGIRHWANAKPCAGGLVVRDGRLLLIERAIEPWLGCWDIPGGFCDADEHPADTVVREVQEETGLDVAVERLLGLWVDVYGDAEHAETTLNCYFLVRPVDDRPVQVDPAEAGAARWFGRGEFPDNLAFPGHAGQVIEAWLGTLGTSAT